MIVLKNYKPTLSTIKISSELDGCFESFNGFGPEFRSKLIEKIEAEKWMGISLVWITPQVGQFVV